LSLEGMFTLLWRCCAV